MSKTLVYTSLMVVVVLIAAFLLKTDSNQPIPNIGFDPIAAYEAKQEPYDLFFLQRSYPDMKHDVDAYKKALKQVSQSEPALKRSSNSNPQNSTFSSAGFDADWTTQGPGNAGARINTIAVHPTNEDIIYLGYSGGGIYKTTDGGDNWTSIFDEQSFLAIGDITLDPNDPDVIYVGTGDPSITGYPFIGDGVYKSDDAGTTWTHLGLSQVGIVSKIQIDPTDTDIIYVAAMGIPFERNFDRGMYKSINGGQTWSQILSFGDAIGVIDMLLNPDNPQIIYAAAWARIRNNEESFATASGSKVFQSTDGGMSWAPLAGGLPNGVSSRVGLAMSGSDSDVVFALYVDDEFDLQAVYKSTDGGNDWTMITDGATSSASNVMVGMGWYFGRIMVDPNDDDHLFIPGVRLFESTNGGAGWSLATPTGVGAPHVDNHAVVMTNSGATIIGTDGGAYRKAAGSSTWEDIENIPTTQVYRTAYNPHQTNQYNAGCQDSGTQLGNAAGINNWNMIGGGDGFQMAFHPTDPDISYYELQRGNIRGTQNGSSYQTVTFGIASTDRRHWDMQYIISKHDPSVMYTGTYRMYKNTNGGFSDWSPISDDLTDGIADLLYVGTTDANVHRSDDGGDNWIDISSGLPNRYVSCIKTSPDSVDHVYVSNTGYLSNEFIPHVHFSADRGATWIDISGNLPQLAVNDLYVMPNNGGNVIFAATDGGIYATLDAGQNWDRLGGNLPIITVYDLDYNVAENLLIAATFGRSVVTFPLDSINVSDEPQTTAVVAGTITNEDDEPIENVSVSISNGVEATQMTGTDGTYNFSGVPVGSSCEVIPTKNSLVLNGLNVVDLYFMERHILLIQALDSPYKILASDVNASGSVNVVDLVLLRKVILLLDEEFENSESWRFVRADYEFPNPGAPFDGLTEGAYDCDGLVGNELNTDFIGYKVGDASGSANPMMFQEEGDTRSTLDFVLENKWMERGKEYTIDFKAKDFEALRAFQFRMGFDEKALELLEVIPGDELSKGVLEFGLKWKEEGVLTGLWTNMESQDLEEETILFSVVFKAKEDGSLENWLELQNEFPGKMAYHNSGDVMGLQLAFIDLPETDEPRNSYKEESTLHPNPFKESTTLNFQLAKEGRVHFSIFGVNGQSIWAAARDYAPGHNQLILDKDRFPAKGIYFLQVEMETHTFVEKIIVE